MCVSIDMLLRLLILLIFLSAVFAVVRIWITPLFSGDTRVTATINVILWLIGALVAVYILIMVVDCFFPMYPMRLH